MTRGAPGPVADSTGRYGIWTDRIAVSLPASVLGGDPALRSVQVQPGVIATLPLPGSWDLSAAARRHLFVSELRSPAGCRGSGGLSLGMPMGSSGWTLRPGLDWLLAARAKDAWQAGMAAVAPIR